MAMSYPQGYQGWNPQTQPQIYGHGQAGQQFNHPPPQQYGGGYNQVDHSNITIVTPPNKDLAKRNKLEPLSEYCSDS